jgi:hypothetical protein
MRQLSCEEVICKFAIDHLVYLLHIDSGVVTISAMAGIQFALAAAGPRSPAIIDLQVQKRH